MIAIAVVQSSRYIKRFYVRRFANNVNRRMKHVLYDSLVHKSRAELEEEGAGNVMTKRFWMWMTVRRACGNLPRRYLIQG